MAHAPRPLFVRVLAPGGLVIEVSADQAPDSCHVVDVPGELVADEPVPSPRPLARCAGRPLRLVRAS